jgi:hypothetical protein
MQVEGTKALETVARQPVKYSKLKGIIASCGVFNPILQQLLEQQPRRILK